MDPTLGAILAVSFPVVLCIVIWAFGRFSVNPD